MSLIVDHDGGVDDYSAVILQLCAGAYEVKAVSVCPGVSFKEPAVRTSKFIADFLGCRDVAIVGGDFEGTNPFPAAWRKDSHEITALGVFEGLVDEPSNVLIDESADRHLSRLLATPGPHTILATGPLTNIAGALQRNPEVTDSIERIWVMGGAVRVRGNVVAPGHDGGAEWNFYNNPAAAAQVVSSGVPITLVALDATSQVPLRAGFLNRLEQQSLTRASRLAAGIWGIVRKYLSSRHPGAYCLWDTLASAALIEPRLIRTERIPIRVVTEGPGQGRTLEDPDGTAVDVAVAADAAATESLFLEMLKRGPR